MWLLVLFYSLVIIGLILFGLLSYARWHVGSLEKMGIPVVKRDHFLLGSAMLTYQKPGGMVDIELMKKYGPVFGVYHGREPQLVVCDPELIRQITTAAADNFNAKRSHDFGDPIFNEAVEFLPLEKWKFVRNLLTPVLTSSVRIKNAYPAMSGSIKDFLEGIRKDIRENGNDGKLDKFCINDAVYGMLTDLMAKSQYSINIGKSDVNNRFVQSVRKLLSAPAADTPWLATYAYAFPFLSKFLPNTMIHTEPMKEFCTIIKELLEMRRKQNEEDGRSPNDPPRDFLDSALEWHNNLHTEEYKKHGITETTILSQALIMFMAGQDQMSLVIGSLMYFLACNPKIEKKVREEVDKVFSQTTEQGTLSHESLSDLTYLTACITEAVRLHPFFFRTERVCTSDWEDKERGLKISKGQVIIIAIWAANRNPEYYEDPEEFKPERFMSGNKEKMHPYAFTSFGFGPRNCPGKRLSMEIMILVAAYILKEFKFSKNEDSGLNFVPAGPFFGAHESIYLDIEMWNRREE